MITKGVVMDIISLHRQGLSMRAIAKKLGIHRNTVKKHIEGNSFPQYRKNRRQKSVLDPYRQIIKCPGEVFIFWCRRMLPSWSRTQRYILLVCRSMLQ